MYEQMHYSENFNHNSIRSVQNLTVIILIRMLAKIIIKYTKYKMLYSENFYHQSFHSVHNLTIII